MLSFTRIQHKRWFGCLKHAFIAWYKLISPLVPNVRRLPISGFNLTNVLGSVKYDSNVFSLCNNTGPNKTSDTPDELTRNGCLKVVTVTLWSYILNVGSIPKTDVRLPAQNLTMSFNWRLLASAALNSGAVRTSRRNGFPEIYCFEHISTNSMMSSATVSFLLSFLEIS